MELKIETTNSFEEISVKTDEVSEQEETRVEVKARQNHLYFLYGVDEAFFPVMGGGYMRSFGVFTIGVQVDVGKARDIAATVGLSF